MKQKLPVYARGLGLIEKKVIKRVMKLQVKEKIVAIIDEFYLTFDLMEIRVNDKLFQGTIGRNQMAKKISNHLTLGSNSGFMIMDVIFVLGFTNIWFIVLVASVWV